MTRVEKNWPEIVKRVDEKLIIIHRSNRAICICICVCTRYIYVWVSRCNLSVPASKFTSQLDVHEIHIYTDTHTSVVPSKTARGANIEVIQC